jgi:hypothetical protein
MLALKIEYTDLQILSLNYLYDLCKKIGWIWYFNDICFISDRPSEIYKKGIVLHHETKPAILFRDGYKVWCLNGINVDRKIVETPAEELDPKILLKETNAEIRREIVRKIGIERVCMKLNALSVEKKDEYELLLLDMGDGRARPYLKMLNPSIHTYHLEGIPPEILTIEQALNWRNQTDEKPFIIT